VDAGGKKRDGRDRGSVFSIHLNAGKTPQTGPLISTRCFRSGDWYQGAKTPTPAESSYITGIELPVDRGVVAV